MGYLDPKDFGGTRDTETLFSAVGREFSSETGKLPEVTLMQPRILDLYLSCDTHYNANQ